MCVLILHARYSDRFFLLLLLPVLACSPSGPLKLRPSRRLKFRATYTYRANREAYRSRAHETADINTRPDKLDEKENEGKIHIAIQERAKYYIVLLPIKKEIELFLFCNILTNSRTNDALGKKRGGVTAKTHEKQKQILER